MPETLPPQPNDADQIAPPSRRWTRQTGFDAPEGAPEEQKRRWNWLTGYGVEGRSTPEQQQRKGLIAKQIAGATGAVVGLGGYYLFAWPIGKTIGWLLVTDFGTSRGWDKNREAQRAFDKGRDRGLKKAA